MKICPACHAELEDDSKFCPFCGRIVKTEEIVSPAQGPAEEPAPEAAQERAEEREPETEAAPAPEEKEQAAEAEIKPAEKDAETTVSVPDLTEEEEEEPFPEDEPEVPAVPKKKGMLSTGQYFLLEALFSIPVVGTVCLFIWSLGHPKNESLHRFSSSVLIWRLIFYILLFAALCVLLLTFKKWAPALARYLSSVSSVMAH